VAGAAGRLMDDRRLARLGFSVLGLNLAVILWGAFVRATGSGAGCGAHWPLCNGEVLPRAREVATLIEFTHRVTSGLALLAVFWLAYRVVRAKPPGHPARRAAWASVFFILTEAAVGAGLVLFRLVADNESVARALFMAVHLMNTFVLLACLALTAHFATAAEPPRPRRDHWPLALAALALLAASASGAVAALGDTLYPARSLLGALADDLSPTAHFLVRLRVAHPLLAVVAAVATVLAALPLYRGTKEAVRRLAGWVIALALLQLATGAVNVLLLAPVWLQLVHLLLADLLWIALVLLAARALAPRGQVLH